jgi:cytochrome c oxidase subunit 2
MKARTCLLGSAVAAPALAGGWLPEAASQASRVFDRHFTFLLVVGAVLVVLLLFAVDVLIFLNLRRDPDQLGRKISDPATYRSLVVLLPLLLVIVLFTSGVRGYVDASMAPTDAITVEALGSPDGWLFRYSAEVDAEELHVPSERPVRLTFDVPEESLAVAIPAFRLRRNARPGVHTEAWFQASQPGEYELLTSGSSLAGSVDLRSKVVVHSAAEFDSWLMSKADVLLTLPPEEAGGVLVERQGCLVCHSTDGSRLTGPSFQGLMGRSSVFVDGESSVADAAYIRQSILEPTARVVEGYQPVMPSFTGRLRDAEIDAIVSYFITLSEPEEAL